MEKGYRVHLANVSAIKQYEGLKQIDDQRSAFWLANLLRLGILPTGYIYPKEERPTRDLRRKRLQLVRHRTSHILSVKNILTRNLGLRMKSEDIKKITDPEVKRFFPDREMQTMVLTSVGDGIGVVTLFYHPCVSAPTGFFIIFDGESGPPLTQADGWSKIMRTWFRNSNVFPVLTLTVAYEEEHEK